MFKCTLGLFLVSALVTQAMAAGAETSSPVVSRVTGKNIESFLFRSKEPQEMSVYNIGSLSFQKRLEMIESAKKSIEVEFFIYSIDEAGRLFTQALVKKAKEGVRVRVLIDYGWPIAELDPFYAKLLLENKIEVRYFNPTVSFELLKGQFRSHRKALIVDDQEGMTGGRNIADEYFDMAPDYNFLDRDIVVRGSMARAMRMSFDEFWNSNITKAPELKIEPRAQMYGLNNTDAGEKVSRPNKSRFDNAVRLYREGIKKANDYLVETEKDRRVLESLKALKSLNGAQVKTHICRDSVFAADMPGVGFGKRVLFKEIQAQIATANKSIHIESPYFVTTVSGMSIISGYLRRGIEVNAYTNSLNSTDAFYTTSVFYPRIGLLISQGMNVFIYRGESLRSQDFVTPEVQKAKWGIHAKSAVLDGRITMVGTFNVDPRSRNINSEMAIMCLDNTELALDVIQNMQEHSEQSVKLNNLGHPVDGSSRYENVSVAKRIIYFLTAPLTNVLSHLL